MSKIRSKNTKPEILIQGLIDGRIFRYQPSGIFGNPDFASKKYNVAVFINGCFWHGCPKCYNKPKSNKVYWNDKLRRNKARDLKTKNILRKTGWKTINLWEHEVINNPHGCADKILKTVNHQR